MHYASLISTQEDGGRRWLAELPSSTEVVCWSGASKEGDLRAGGPGMFKHNVKSQGRTLGTYEGLHWPSECPCLREHEVK